MVCSVHKISKFKINGKSYDKTIKSNLSPIDAENLVLLLREQELDDRYTYIMVYDKGE